MEESLKYLSTVLVWSWILQTYTIWVPRLCIQLQTVIKLDRNIHITITYLRLSLVKSELHIALSKEQFLIEDTY